MMVVAYKSMTFAEKLERLIELRGTSQSELSRKTGLAQSAISEMTKGKRRAYMDQSLLLARALDVSLDYLADDEVESIPTSRMTAMETRVWEVVQTIGAAEAWRRLLGTALRAETDLSPGGPGYQMGEPVNVTHEDKHKRSTG